MSGHLEPQLMFACAADRRFWLLRKALESLPLDQAVELARTAESFITEATARVTVPTGAQPPVTAPVVAKNEIAPAEEIAKVTSASTFGPEVRERRNESHLPLSKEQREELLGRMAKGARNSELAADYGLNARQAQGIRMGSGREIARRRARLNAGTASPERVEAPEKAPLPESADPTTAGIEEVVRYLRQQDDVVVPQDDGVFLVNARFRIAPDELVARANRMRARQGKPQFNLRDGLPVTHEGRRGPVNGHPMFWENTGAQA